MERELCGFEQNMVQRNLHDVYYVFQVAVRYKNSPFRLRMLKQFLTQMCDQWSQLVLQVKNKTILRPLEKIEFGDLVLDLSDRNYDSYESAIKDIFAEYTHYQFKYDCELPLWKILVYKDVLIFICDHVLFDGTSGRLFHEFAGNYLETKSSNIPQHCSLNDVIFDLNDHPNFFVNPSPTVLQPDFFPPDNWSNPKPITNALPTFDKELLKLPIFTHYSTLYRLSAESTSKLILVSRANKIKLTGLLYGLISTSLISTGILNGDKLTSSIPINTRLTVEPQLGIADFPFGLFFAKYLHSVDISKSPLSFKDDKFWEYCQYFHKCLNEAIPESLYSYGKAEKAFLEDPDLPSKTMQTLATVERDSRPSATFIISNLGALSSKECGDCWFEQAMADGAFACHVIGSPAGLCLDFTAHRGVSKSAYQAYVESSIESIGEFLKVN